MKKSFKILVLILLLSMGRIKGIKAESFYEDNWITGVYANLVDGDFSKPQLMRFIRRRSDNKPVYCLTPRYLLYDDQEYTRYDVKDISDFSVEKLKRINKIAYFGYGYKNHTSNEWYAITQIMIWKEVEPNMDIFFTDKYNGNRIIKYENEMNEINNLISEYEKLPALFSYDLMADQKYKFVDHNDAIKNFNLYSDNGIEVSVDNNILNIYTEEKGNYRITFYKDDNLYYDNPYVYKAEKGQIIFMQGTIGGLSYSINANVINNELQITKQDIDTLEYISGVKYDVYDEFDNYVGEIVTNENGVGRIDHLDNKLYKLKEKEAPKEYQIDNEYHDIYIYYENNFMSLYNEKIKANFIINKYISNDSILQPEKDAEFEIYDDKNNLISTIITNNNGVANTILPYGKYKVHQTISKEGYKKIDDFNIEISNTEDIIYYLKNQKIIEKTEVPNKDIEKIEDPKKETKKQELKEEVKKNVEDIVENTEKNIDNSLSNTIENPKTSDAKIYIYIILGYISFIAVLYLFASIKNNKE